MPELPEVETVVRDLRPLLVGRSFVKIDVGRKALRRKWSRAWETRMIGQRVQAIERRGKWILIELGGPPHPQPLSHQGRGEALGDPPHPQPLSHQGRGEALGDPPHPQPLSHQGRGEALGDPPHPQPLSHQGRGEAWLVVHLGMTGQFTVVPVAKPRETHTHVVFTLDDGGELRFRDVRRFGSITLHPDRAALMQFFVNNGLGPEPFDFDAAYWRECLRSTRRNLKAILLDQTVIAGVGNIYADESLFEAKLHPTLIGADVTAAQARMLRHAIGAVLTRAIEQRGSSIRDYIGGSGLKGNFQDEFCVYGRTGEPCVRCKVPIERIVLAGRSTHFCPQCQRKR